MEWSLSKDRSTFLLRYYLPCRPIYDETVTHRRSESLIRYCVRNRISAVMLYVDLNPYWYYMPDDLSHTKYYVNIIEQLSFKLRENNISYQLNYQNLFGAWDGGADLRNVNQWENYVDQNGKESCGCACCIGEKFRKIAGEKLRLWAATKPDVIWIDDDIRFHNHRTAIRDFWNGVIPSETLDFGCFCNRHIEKFNKKFGLNYSRDEIVKGILDGDRRKNIRKKWMDFSGETADDVARWIEKTVHEVSRDTKIAVMTSLPDVHGVEGRNWRSFLQTLSGGKRPLLRPTFGPYAEREPQEFFMSYLLLEQLKTEIKLQGAFDFCPEIENTRFTRWSKSIAATGYQMMLSAFLGCRGVTLSIFDLEGCVLDEEPEFAALLNERHSFADMMAKENLWEMENEGVALITASDRIAEVPGKKVSEISQLANGRLWDRSLLKMGIPCKYISPQEVGVCMCAALDGYTAGLLTDSELFDLFSKGLILDAGAAKILNQRGFTEYIGVEVGEAMGCIAASEVFHTLKHMDGSSVRLPLRIDGGKWNHLHLHGAETVSAILTPYGTEHAGLTRFENSKNGLVYVFAGNGSLGDGFFSNHRVRLIKDICSEISRDSIVKINNSSYAISVVKKEKDKYYVFVANLCADNEENIIIELPILPKEAIWIDMSGHIHKAIVKENKIYCVHADLKLYECLVCEINTDILVV